MNPESGLKSTKTELFEFQKWPVYVAGKQLVKSVNKISKDLPHDGKRGLKDQLNRASQSIVLNIAEGCSRYGNKDKNNFLRMAKGSAFECVAVLDLLSEMEYLDRQTVDQLVCQLAEIGKMLSGLIRYLENKKY